MSPDDIAAVDETDNELKSMVKHAALLALHTQIELMTTGTPEQRQRAAAGFNSVLGKALGEGEGDDEVAEAKAKMRRVIGGMLKKKREQARNQFKEAG